MYLLEVMKALESGDRLKPTTADPVLFHGSERFREGQLANLEREDINGFRFVEAIIKAGAAGGEIVEYYYDDPAIEGDGDSGSPKLGYATGITFPSVDGVLVIGSGLYIAE